MTKHCVLSIFQLVWWLLLPGFTLAQGHKISGRIVDAETLDPLPYAHVFIDQTTLGAVSDINGEYVIEDLKDGAYKLVFSYVGYELFYQTVVLNGTDARVSARLVPQLEMLQSVEVKGSKDKEWEAKLKQFNRVFFGDTEWARACKITNPWALDFTYDVVEKKTKAVASEPIEIENRALGYRIVCTLQLFAFDKTTYKIHGLYKFEELNTLDKREATQWTRNRRVAYQNSLRFLMKSIADNHFKENGFDVYKDKRPEKYVSESGLFSRELDKNLEPLNAAIVKSPAGTPGLYKLSFDGRVEVHHTTQYASHKTYEDVSHPVSWVETEKGYVIVDEEGQIQNSGQIITSGELNHIRIAGMLPLNYSPGSFVVVNYLTKRNEAKRLQERIFLQTDKASYYAGENIWFKAHINYALPALRDSLSRVVYVEVIDPKNNIITTNLLKSDTVGTYGVIPVPKDWTPGRYFLRAYTAWMRNYGADVIDYTPFRILPNDIVLHSEPELALQNSEDFIVTPIQFHADSAMYQIALDTNVHRAWVSCSISVAPYAFGSNDQSMRLRKATSFLEDLPDGTLGDFVFPLEYGFSIAGRVNHPKGKKMQASMTVIQGRLDSLYSFKTDRKGDFKIEELDFYDTVSFSFQAVDKKGRPFKSVELQPRSAPTVKLRDAAKWIKADSLKLDYSFQLFDIESDTVQIGAAEKKVNNPEVRSLADYLLTDADLRNMPQGLSILMALQGRIPGLSYNSSTRALTFRGAKSNAQGNIEPLVLVDGTPYYSTLQGTPAEQNLQSVNQEQQAPPADNYQQAQQLNMVRQAPNQKNNDAQSNSSASNASVMDLVSHVTVSSVTRVEVFSRADPRYGTMGTNGVISIYTRKEQLQATKPPLIINRHVVKGFDRPVNFYISTDYNDQGKHVYQPTLYWNPRLVISPNKPLLLKVPVNNANVVYRIAIGGITQGGIPVFGEFLFDPRSVKPVNAQVPNLDLRQR